MTIYITKWASACSRGKLSPQFTGIFLLMIIGHTVSCQQKAASTPGIGKYIDDYAKSISTSEQSFLDWRTDVVDKPSFDSLREYKEVHDRYVGKPFPERNFLTIDDETVAPVNGRAPRRLSCYQENQGQINQSP